jgi:hypothetical protein
MIFFLNRLTLTAMSQNGGMLVLLNFETIVYFCKMNKKIKNIKFSKFQIALNP